MLQIIQCKLTLPSNELQYNFCFVFVFTTGKQAGFCMLCELQRHIRRCYEHAGQAVRPQCILQKLKCKCFSDFIQGGHSPDDREKSG